MQAGFKTLTVAIVAFCLLAGPGRPALARDGGAPSATGKAFSVPEPDAALYRIRTPEEEVGGRDQRVTIQADDGVDLYLDAWLPDRAGGAVPPERVPVVLSLTPYAQPGTLLPTYQRAMELLVPRGYAFVQLQIRGTGASGGCRNEYGTRDRADFTEVVRFLVDDAPWSNGNIGSFGYSAGGATQLALATSADPVVKKHLKAMIVGAPADPYELNHFDGVPVMAGELLTRLLHQDRSLFTDHSLFDVVLNGSSVEDFAAARLSDGGLPSPQHLTERFDCIADESAALDSSGDVAPYWAERDWHRRAGNIRTPTFMWQGLRDLNVTPVVQAGLFDRITAPKTGIFGWFDHEPPDNHSSGVAPEWERGDFSAMMLAWYDHWLRSEANGVPRWPNAQVQANDGQWREESNWPLSGGRMGSLVLGAGTLGEDRPFGSSTFKEALVPLDEGSPIQEPNNRLVFTSGRLEGRLEISGQPVLDVWIRSDKADAHLGAVIRTYDADGEPIDYGSVLGFRSLRHIDPMPGNYFAQAEGRPFPIDSPQRVSLRFHPTDLVVPAGGRVEVVVAGAQRVNPGIEGIVGLPSIIEQPSESSGSNALIEVLHDCTHLSALRFDMPSRHPKYLDVLERGEDDLAAGPWKAVESDGGGLAAGRTACSFR